MTGPEHYLAAEECLAEAAKAHANSSMPMADRSAWLMEAQVHATLALAATALRDHDDLQARLEAAQEYVKAQADHIASQY